MLGRVTGLAAGFAVEVDEGTEAMRFPPDDGNHQRQSESPGSRERGGRPADADPDRYSGLVRTGVNALIG